MYAWLFSSNTADISIKVKWWSFHCWDPAAPNPTGANRLTTLLQTECRSDPDAQRARLQAALQDMLPWLPTDEVSLDSCLHLALLHHRLPDPQRTEREQRIARLIAAQFGPPNGWEPWVREHLTGLQRLAVLTPDQLLDDHVRSACVGYAIQAFFQHITSNTPPTQQSYDYQFLTLVAVTCGGEKAQETRSDLLQMYLQTDPALRSKLMECLVRLYTGPHLDWLAIVLKSFVTAEFSGTGATRVDTLNRALTALADSLTHESPTQHDVVLMAEHMVYQMRARQLAVETWMLGETLVALAQGKNLGVHGPATQQAITELGTYTFTQSIIRSPDWFRSATGQEPASQPPSTPITMTVESIPDTESDGNAARTWATKQAIDWFEGPVATPQKAGAIDRSKARTKLQTRNNKATRSARLPVKSTPRANKAPPPREDDTWTVDDIGQILQNALHQSATFFLDEVNDLVVLGKTQNAPTPAIQDCMDIVPTLTQFLAHPPINEVAARQAFAQAETSIQTLRQQIRAVEGETRLREQFDRCLVLALKSEVMVHGKRYGGQIACALPMEAWSWVNQRYHRRWLSGATQIVTEDGVIASLQPHEALALHVTANSRSGYAFDISVHLWYRRPNRTSAPSTTLDPYPPMNHNDWFDTCIPCTVLHIPHK